MWNFASKLFESVLSLSSQIIFEALREVYTYRFLPRKTLSPE